VLRADNKLNTSNQIKEKIIKWSIFAGTFFLLIFSYTRFWVVNNGPKVPSMSIQQVKERLNHPDVVIIDVRKSRNWLRSSKKILSAVRENPSEVDQWAQKYPKDKLLVFY